VWDGRWKPSERDDLSTWHNMGSTWHVEISHHGSHHPGIDNLKRRMHEIKGALWFFVSVNEPPLDCVGMEIIPQGKLVVVGFHTVNEGMSIY